MRKVGQVVGGSIGAGAVVLLGVRAAFAAFGDVGSFVKLLPLPFVKFISTPEGTLFLLLFGFGLIWWGVRHPREAPDVAAVISDLRADIVRLGGRSLTLEQRSIVLRRLRAPIENRDTYEADKRRMPVYITRAVGALDAEALAETLCQLIAAAGGMDPRNLTTGGAPEMRDDDLKRGIWVCRGAEWCDWMPRYDRLIVEGLRDAGIEVSEYTKRPVMSGITIVIGVA
ncbi:MAG TPA: hypothetical protein VNA69_06170 [Thermoanaerobaculia bacterium]|nr:hypothetical protein [Thermoanaerobaculia bacterium]